MILAQAIYFYTYKFLGIVRKSFPSFVVILMHVAERDQFPFPTAMDRFLRSHPELQSDLKCSLDKFADYLIGLVADFEFTLAIADLETATVL